jgi:phosphate transport system permease protein
MASAAMTAHDDRPVRPKTVDRKDLAIMAGSAVSSFAFVWLLFRLAPLSGGAGFGILWFAAFVAIYWLVVRETEGSLAARDKVAGAVITSLAVGLAVPLVLIIGFVVVKGVKAFSLNFFTQTLQFVGPLDPATKGGAAQAIVGTLEQIGLAIVISVPLGLATAIFLNEVGGPLKRPVRIFVDAMSGVPSIVAGLFIYAVWIVQFHHTFSGFAASMALAVLMLPTITRTGEEVLRLVPDGLREASLALGATEWRTTLGVVVPTARSGLVTAVILGVARAVGETAPLIMTSFGASVMNTNAFHAAQDSLPLFVYRLIRFPQQAQLDRAWTGALVLIGLVLILFVAARVVGRSAVRGVRPRRPVERPAKEVP